MRKQVRKNTQIGCTNGAALQSSTFKTQGLPHLLRTVHSGVSQKTNGNDPSAGSPTETLLRLLLPLNASVWSSSREWISVSQLNHNPRTSLKRSIGSSDGRCVQRAGT